MRCNYRVTCDDRAWNQFLKKGLLTNFAQALNYVCTVTFLVGPYLELGDFRSALSCALPKLPPIAAGRKQREKRRMLKSSNRSATMETVVPMAIDSATNVTSVLPPFFERAIDLAFERIAAECAYQRDV